MSASDKRVKEYATDEIVVEWDSRLCYHSHNCVRALPRVFDPDRRPWVKVEEATADEVEAAVSRCPLRRAASAPLRVGAP
jgi:omega-amidase